MGRLRAIKCLLVSLVTATVFVPWYTQEHMPSLSTGLDLVYPPLGAYANAVNETRRNSAPFAFAACLLLQDDNKILPEWLAYHYEFLPLRYLIVNADPGNVTSPEPILDHWRDMGMRIEVWLGRRREEFPNINTRHKHFIMDCISHLKRQNWTWTLFVDSDEYVVFNRLMENEREPWRCSSNMSRYKRWGLRQNCIKRKRADRLKLPKVGSMTAAEYIHRDMRSNLLWTQYACIYFPRVFFGPQESSADEVSDQVPRGFNPTAFQTLQYRKYTFMDKPGKSIVDASRHNATEAGIHRVIPDGCSPKDNYGPFRVHHYTSSLEVFLSRPSDDTSRTKKIYERRTNFTPVGSNDDVRGWLGAFVKTVGHKKAYEMTENTRSWAFADDARAREKLMKAS